MSTWAEVRLAEYRYRAAMARGEAVEVVAPLMSDLATALHRAGHPQEATYALGLAADVAQMKGMHAERERAALPWWRRRRYTAPDYAARVAIYRTLTRECWLPEGDTDFWPTTDPDAGYEFRPTTPEA